ncbi:MAG: hypothetical protein ACLTK0_06255 [Anaerovoracaceae bacterium]
MLILVSQTVTQKDIHIKQLTKMVELVEAEGIRDKVILTCGGPRISHELAQELGYDAGFGLENSRARYVLHNAGSTEARLGKEA